MNTWILTVSLPVLFEHPNSRGCRTTPRRALDVWYSFLPPRAAQKPAGNKEKRTVFYWGHLTNTTLWKSKLFTWLLCLLHPSSSSSKEAGNIVSCSHLIWTCTLSLPQEKAIRSLQHKHIIGVQRGCSGLHLCGCDRKIGRSGGICSL